jgi:hypothetical protein
MCSFRYADGHRGGGWANIVYPETPAGSVASVTPLIWCTFEKLERIVRRLPKARSARASMFQLIKIMKHEFGLPLTASQIWQLITDAVPQRELFAGRDPGMQVAKYGSAGERAGRKTSTWHTHGVAQRRPAARDRENVIVVDPNWQLREARERLRRPPKSHC